MRTPYDTALKIRRHEIDAFADAIRQEVLELSRIEVCLLDVASALAEEARCSLQAPLLPNGHFNSRMQGKRRSLMAAHMAAQARLTELRSKAAAAMGAFQTMETAADIFLAEECRKQDNAEQAALDDIVGSAIVRHASSGASR